MNVNDMSNSDHAVGDDGLTDDQRRLAKQRARDAAQKKADAAGDAERERQERAAGEAPGARGRVTGERGPEKTNVPTGAKVAPRKAQSK